MISRQGFIHPGSNGGATTIPGGPMSQCRPYVNLALSTGRDGRVTELQDAEEVYEVLFLFVREPNLEAAIEEVHQFGQIPDGTVGEVGCAGGESAELLHHDGADIRAFSGDECTAGVLS